MEYFSKKSLWKWILLYVIIGVIVYGLIYYFFFYKKGYSNNPHQVQNYKVFSSSDLGITFTYAPKDENNSYDVGVTRVVNKVYIYNSNYPKEQGQSIEVFTKDPKVSLEEAIKAKFLQGYDPKNCFVINSVIGGFTDSKELSNYVAAQISFPPTNNPEGPWWDNNSKCPTYYSQTNAVQYFLMNKDIPDRFLFVVLGQAPITNDGLNSNVDWSHSIRIIKLTK